MGMFRPLKITTGANGINKFKDSPRRVTGGEQPGRKTAARTSPDPLHKCRRMAVSQALTHHYELQQDRTHKLGKGQSEKRF